MEATLIETQKHAARRRPPRFELIAGDVCLDFLNTLDDRYHEHPKELLESYLDVVRFAEDSGILPILQVDRLIERTATHPEEANESLRRAIELREAMYAVFWALVQKKPVPPLPLHTLNAYIREAARHAMLKPGREHFDWKFEELPRDFDAPLWPLARAAGELLASERLRFLKACASKTCEWLFLDESKNHRKRWCDMTKCGNRAKAQRFYNRQKRGTKKSEG